jgi:hypothetical protein
VGAHVTCEHRKIKRHRFALPGRYIDDILNFSELAENLIDIDEISIDIWYIDVDKHASFTCST